MKSYPPIPNSGSIMGDIMILGKNSLNLNFEHCVN